METVVNDTDARTELAGVAGTRPCLSVQWHITDRCARRCRHCYAGRDASACPPRGELGLPEIEQILDEFGAFSDRWGIDIGLVALSGGDPLASPIWRPVLAALRARNIPVAILGNPETLSADVIAELRVAEVVAVQLSLEGLESTNDACRGAGSFRDVLAKVDVLAAAGIPTNIMTTVFPHNAGELLPLVRFLAERSAVSSFSFDLGCHLGNATQFEDRFTAPQVAALFTAYLAEKERLARAGYSLRLHEKPCLFALSHTQAGSFVPVPYAGEAVVSGCLCGWLSVAILSDGTVLPCRRLPLPIGKLPEQRFADVFLGAPLMQQFRRRESYRACGSCRLYAYCRGCPAYTYAATGDPFAINPLCFAGDRHGVPAIATRAVPHSTSAQEAAKVTACVMVAPLSLLESHARRPAFAGMLVDLCQDAHEREQFRRDPLGYAGARYPSLDANAVAVANHLLGGRDGPNLGPRRHGFLADHALDLLLAHVVAPAPQSPTSEENPP